MQTNSSVIGTKNDSNMILDQFALRFSFKIDLFEFVGSTFVSS